MKTFPKPLLKQILADIDAFSAQPVESRIAAFDADGTLWNVDLGEQFFEFQIQSGQLEGLPPDPWAHYQNMKLEKSPQAAYLWLAQINSGKRLEQVQAWAKESFERNKPVPVFEFQMEIIEKLKSLQFKIYIVTASIAWAVEPAASLFGLPQEVVLGVRTKVKNAYVTEEQDGIITYKKGKVDALLAKSGGLKPLFVSGNTEGDLPLLESSLGLRFVISSAQPEESNYETEMRMQEVAKLQGWHHFRL